MTEEVRQKKIKIELYNDHFQNFKRYQIPKAQNKAQIRTI
jgi:site-specific DNA-methyltransferase (adenine-specific)